MGAAAAPDGHRLSDCDFGCRNFLGQQAAPAAEKIGRDAALGD